METQYVSTVYQTNFPNKLNQEVERRLSEITPEQRITTGLTQREKLFQGEWEAQKGKPLCTMLAVVNATRALGGTISAHAKEEMYTIAQTPDEEDKLGLTYDEVNEILAKSYDNVVLEDLPAEKALGKIQVWPTSENSEYNNRIVKINAEVITSIIDSGEGLLVTIMDGSDKDMFEEGLHAICLVGYKINENGTMDVQYIDSNQGIFLRPLEYFSMLILDDDIDDPGMARIVVKQ